jgi:endonuclease YncB( thermonuclease family)
MTDSETISEQDLKAFWEMSMLSGLKNAISKIVPASVELAACHWNPKVMKVLYSTVSGSIALALCLYATACGGVAAPSKRSTTPSGEPAVSPSEKLPSGETGPGANPELEEYVLIRAIDGDTIDVKPVGGGDKQRVRLIGVDTPESKDPRRPVECFAEEASKFTSRLEGKLVRLEFDVERYDRYGRTLAYVYLSDGTFFNLVLVEEGYAQPYTVPPNVRYQDQFVEAGRRAREAGRGLWGKC